MITNAPEFTGSIRANFDFPLFGGLLTASVGYSYRDESMLTNEGGADPRDPTGQTPLEPLMQDFLRAARRLGRLAVAQRPLAHRHLRQEPHRRGVPDERLQPAGLRGVIRARTERR